MKIRNSVLNNVKILLDIRAKTLNSQLDKAEFSKIRAREMYLGIGGTGDIWTVLKIVKLKIPLEGEYKIEFPELTFGALNLLEAGKTVRNQHPHSSSGNLDVKVIGVAKRSIRLFQMMLRGLVK